MSVLAKTIDRQNLIEVMHENPSVSCEKEIVWPFGSELLKLMKMSNFNGLSGHIEFDSLTGSRSNITLAIVDKTKTGVDLVYICLLLKNKFEILLTFFYINKVGYWKEVNPKKPIEIVRSYAKEKDQVLDKLNRNLIVTTKLVRILKLKIDFNLHN